MLRQGEFFGAPVVARELGDFALSIWSYDAATSIPWHAHESAYVTFVVRGAYREHLRDETRSCSTRAIVTHAPGEVHADDFSAAATCLSIECNRRSDYDEMSVVMQSASASAIGDRIIAELRRHDVFSPMVIEGLMLEMFAEAARSRVPTIEPHWLRGVRAMIAANFDARLTLTALAREANVHPTHLARAFRRHDGRTIGEAIRQSRVEKAKERIVAGDALCNVALECGFADQSHLTRSFRRITGMTPAEFRRVNKHPKR